MPTDATAVTSDCDAKGVAGDTFSNATRLLGTVFVPRTAEKVTMASAKESAGPNSLRSMLSGIAADVSAGSLAGIRPGLMTKMLCGEK